MTVRLDGDTVCLEGPCQVEDAEALLSSLLAAPDRIVDLTDAGHLHAAVVQVLLALQPALIGPAGDPFVQQWVLPHLAQHRPPASHHTLHTASGVPR